MEKLAETLAELRVVLTPILEITAFSAESESGSGRGLP